MAARENQGLQIALIIFVMLTIILSVTTFLFYRNFKGATRSCFCKGLSDQGANGRTTGAGRAESDVAARRFCGNRQSH